MVMTSRKPLAFLLGMMILTCCGASTRTASGNSTTGTTGTTASTGSTTATVSLGPKIGFNLALIGNTSWQAPLLNRFKSGRDWAIRIIGAGYGTVDPAQLNADGWPIAMPSAGYWEIRVPLDSFPGTTSTQYVMRWKGTGAISLGTVGEQKIEDHKVTFENVGGTALVDITATNANDPIRDVSIVRSDQVAAYDAGAILNPAFVDRIVKPFSVFRTMDWDQINTSTETNWADRQKPTDALWSRMPLEVEVALANAGGVDLWKTIPTNATDDYVRQTAAYIRDNLSPGLKVHLEYSNEVWNGSFQANAYAAAQAKARWGITDFGANTFYGYRAAQIASIAWTAFGGTSTTRLRPVLSGFFAFTSPELNDAMAHGVSLAGLGSVSSLFREYAVAVYFGDAMSFGGDNLSDQAIILGWAKDQTGNGLTQAFTQLAHGGLLAAKGSSLDDARYSIEPVHGAWARANGLDMVGYEGGFAVSYFMASTENQTILQSFFQRMLDDPRMGLLYTRWAQDFAANGGKLLVAYNDIGDLSGFGPWGALPSIYAADTPRYTSLRASALVNPGP